MRACPAAVLGLFGLVLLGALATGPAARAAADPPGAGLFGVPSDCSLTFGAAEQAGPGAVRLSGYVDIVCGASRIQADTVVYDTRKKTGVAEGTVVLDWEMNRITGERLEFDLAARTGTMTEANGWIEPETLIRAATIEKLDDEHVLLEKGEFTTCTQPIPYWSFRIGRGMFHLKHYAHLRHVRMNVGRVPILYLPWMLWPIKGDRAAGLLFPQWGSSRKYGFFAGEAFFWPLGRSADITIYGDYYSLAGPAGGIEANWLPDERGRLRLTTYYLKDNERDEQRSAERLQVQQGFGEGWRLFGELNAISDFQYYQDFERNLANAAANYTLSTMSLVRNGDYSSLAVRASRRRQFFVSVLSGTGGVPLTSVLRTELTQDAMPEIELRGRSRRLTGTPLYFSYDASLGYLRRDCDSADGAGAGFAADCGITGTGGALRDNAGWGRVDLTTGLAAPIHPAPWLAFEPRAILHETYYTAARDPATGRIDESADVGRTYYELQAQLIGPRFYRVFESPTRFSSRWKHVLEPRLTYRYAPVIQDQDRVPIFDERDLAARQLDLASESTLADASVASDAACRDLREPGDTEGQSHSCATVSLRTRLLAKRSPRWSAEAAKPLDGSATGGALPWSSFPVPVEPPPQAAPGAVTTDAGPDGPGPGTHAPGVAPDAGQGGTPGPGASTSSSGQSPPFEAGTEPRGGGAPAQAEAEANPVEIANFEISQSYSFTNPLAIQFRERCSDGTPRPPCVNGEAPVLGPEGTRRVGPILLTFHLNPASALSVDLGTSYDALNRAFTASSLSGWYRWKAGYVNTTWYRQNPPGSLEPPSSQIRVGAGSGFFNRKLTLDGDLGYDLGGSATLDRRARAGYYTQCCGFVVEYLERDFVGSDRREVRFVVDLKGIGKFLDLGGVTSQ